MYLLKWFVKDFINLVIGKNPSFLEIFSFIQFILFFIYLLTI